MRVGLTRTCIGQGVYGFGSLLPTLAFMAVSAYVVRIVRSPLSPFVGEDPVNGPPLDPLAVADSCQHNLEVDPTETSHSP